MTENHFRPIRTALLSVTDKSGLLELTQALINSGITTVLASDGTAHYLRSQGLTVKSISEYTGFPEILGGRVKTLHPKIHAGLLFRGEADLDTLKQHDILPIDLLVANLYDFEGVCDQSEAEAIEHIDIGGVTLLRAAAKNFTHTAVLSNPKQYTEFLAHYRADQGTHLNQRKHWAQQAFQTTAQLEQAVSGYFQKIAPPAADPARLFPEHLSLQLNKQADLRYGENPHQKAAAYSTEQSGLLFAEQLQGKSLSYNNLLDADAALRLVQTFEAPTVVIVKHNNPCAVVSHIDLNQAYQQAFQADPISAFGGVIACNRPLTADWVQTILKQQFAEVILSLGYQESEKSAIQAVGASKPNVRILSLAPQNIPKTQLELRSIVGGMLIQETDQTLLWPEKLQIPTLRQPTPKEWDDLHFAWKVCRFVKSNAIVFAQDQRTLGIGAGQMSRVASARIARDQAQVFGFTLHEAVMASDAFFPFKDSVEEAAQAGITAIIQPGGSIRDEEVIETANHFGIAMVLTGIRHFSH